MTDERVIRVLSQLRVPHNLLGRACLEQAISFIVQNQASGCCRSLTTIVYPDVAKSLNTTAGAVERRIRTAIKKTVQSIDANNIGLYNTIFGVSDLAKTGISNSEFIFDVASYVLGRIVF